MRGWLAALALALLVPAVADADPAVVLSGACQYAYVPLIADPAVARALVPSEFAVLGAPAAALAFHVVARCTASVAGGAVRPLAFRDDGIVIAGPDGSPGLHLYRLWEITDDPALAAANERFGSRAVLAPVAFDIAESTLVLGGADELYSEVGWEESRSVLAAQVTSTAHEGLDGVVSWWTATPAGLLRVDHAFLNEVERHGAGTLHADGALADLASGFSAVETNVIDAHFTAIATTV